MTEDCPEFDIEVPMSFQRDILEMMAKKQYDVASESILNYVKGQRRFYTVRDDENSEMWVYNDGIYMPHGKSYIKECCRLILGRAYTTYFANQVIAKMEADTFVDSDSFFKVGLKDEIAIKNGVLNLKTRVLSPFTPDKIFFNKIPVDYDQSALCPAIEKFFMEILKNPLEDTLVIYEWTGYFLYKEYFIEKALMMSGTGRNGKGKTISLWKSFLGPENFSAVPIQHFEADLFSVSLLLNKMANLCGDISKKALYDTGMFKQLRGRDTVSANRKFLPRVNFQNYAKMVFAANELPISYDNSPAFWNSWTVLEFPYKFVSQQEWDSLEDKALVKVADPFIIDKLTTPSELSGLLNKALDGLDRIREKKDFSSSKTVQDVTMLWIRRADSFRAFILDEIIEDYDSMISKSDLRKEYSIYCREHKVQNMIDKHILSVLSEMGVGDEREWVYDDNGKKQIRIWKGIKFRQARQPSHSISTNRESTNLPTELEKVTSLSCLSQFDNENDMTFDRKSIIDDSEET